jgi:glycosyltransferase involved in cell wall biosynthesis
MHAIRNLSQVQHSNIISTSYPIRVLEVVFLMGSGGIESYLLNILRRVDRQRFQVDLLVHALHNSSEPHLQELEKLGCRIIRCPDPRKFLLTPWRYIQAFKKAIAVHGPYDVIHSHAAPIDGAILHLARQAGIPNRIVTCHSSPPLSQIHNHKPGPENLLRRFYHKLSNLWVAQHATLGLGVSSLAAEYMFGSNWQKDDRWRVLFCGFDLQPFKQSVDNLALRQELGIPPNAFVVGNVGRFNYQKNHKFLVEVASEAIRQDRNIYFLLIGDGELRTEIEQQIQALGLTQHFIFAGLRSDVPQLMLGAMDAFLVPSWFEGLPLVLLEAQAAGLPCIFTRSLAHELDTITPLIHRLDLSETPKKWAAAILQSRQTRAEIDRKSVLQAFEQSSFNVDVAAHQLFELYEQEVKQP